jgi:hypothetical protein
MVNIHCEFSGIGISRLRNLAKMLKSISKCLKKRCSFLYFEAICADPESATAISVRQTVLTLIRAKIKSIKNEERALFQPNLDFTSSMVRTVFELLKSQFIKYFQY